MIELNHPSRSQLVESLKVLERGLRGHFRGGTLRVYGRVVQVEDVVEALRRHVATIERATEAEAYWLEEASFQRDEFRGEISPLLVTLRIFIASMFGATSARMREFGFEPVRIEEEGAKGSEKEYSDDDGDEYEDRDDYEAEDVDGEGAEVNATSDEDAAKDEPSSADENY